MTINQAATELGVSVFTIRRWLKDGLLPGDQAAPSAPSPIRATDDIRDDPTKVYDQVLQHIGAPTGFVPPHLDRVLYSNAASRWAPGSELDDEQRRIVYMLYRRDVTELEAMVGRYLPAWDPGPPPPRWRESLPWFQGR